MSRFVFALCLLLVPLSYGVPTSDPVEEIGTALVLERPNTPAKCRQQFEKEILNNLTRIGPESTPLVLSEDGQVRPVLVTVNSHIRDIERLQKIEGGLYHWNLELILRQTWNDKRLAYDITDHPEYKYIFLNTPESQKLIWKPDTFFSNAKSGDFHSVTAPNSYVWIYPDGTVLYSVRLTLALRCHNSRDAKPVSNEEDENAHDFICPVRIAAYGYTTEKVVYNWKQDSPIQLHRQLYIPNHTLKEVTTENSEGKTLTGSWSSLIANFRFSPNKSA